MKKGFKPDNYENPSKYRENGKESIFRWRLLIDSSTILLFHSPPEALQGLTSNGSQSTGYGN